MSINTECLFSYDKIDHSKENEGHLMVTLESPERDFDRTPLCSVLVLDVSASMGGTMKAGEQNKLDALKQIAKCLVKQLSSQDEIAIVAYSDTSEVVLQRITVKDKDKIYSAIDKLRTISCTNIGSGLIDGFRCINNDWSGVKRVFLVSDGLNNQGSSNPQIVDLVKNRKEYGKNLVVSTFGLGYDCDQELMADLAKAGEGNYYFVEDAKDMRETFARELGGALACDAQNIEIHVKPNNGNEVIKVLNDFNVEDKKGVAVINAEDLYVGETRHILIQMKIDKVAHPKPRKVSVAHVEVIYHDVQGKKQVTDEHNARVQFVESSKADKDEKLVVSEQVAVLKVAEAAIKATKQANAGDFDAAQATYTEAMGFCGFAANAGSDLCESMMDGLVANNANWNAHSYTQDFGTARTSEARGYQKMRGTSGESVELYANVAAKNMVKSFQDDATDVVAKIQEAQDVAQAAKIAKAVKPAKKEGFTKKRSGNS